MSEVKLTLKQNGRVLATGNGHNMYSGKREWHGASGMAQGFARQKLGSEFSGEYQVDIKSESGEQRTYKVRGYFVHKSDGREVRKLRQEIRND